MPRTIRVKTWVPATPPMLATIGTQVLTLMVRGLALGQVGVGNLRALLAKEVLVGIVNGGIWAVVVGAVSALWFQDGPLGLVIGLAMLVNLINAALAGVLVPLTLRRMNIDPALAGGVVLTTFTDVVGFLSFLGLGTLILLK